MEQVRFQRFLESLLNSLWSVRCWSFDSYDHHLWTGLHSECHAKINLAFDISLITYAQVLLLRKLLTNASIDYCGKPFPSPQNAGPVIPWFELHKRKAAILQLRDF